MALFILTIALITLICGSNLLNLLAGQINFFNSLCLTKVPLSAATELSKSLICGSNLNNFELESSLKSLGLIHLMVVSGIHLLFLENLIDSAGVKKRALLLGLLTPYVLVSGAQPPVVRAWLSLLLKKENVHYKMNWSPVQICFLTGAFCLIVHPPWVMSLSLSLSWTASLILSLSQQNFKKKSPLLRHSLIFIFISPLLLPLGVPHPLSILINLFLGPLLGQILLPLAFLHFLLPHWTGNILHILQEQLIHLAQYIPPPLEPIKNISFYFLAYPLLLHLGLALQRKNYKEYEASL